MAHFAEVAVHEVALVISNTADAGILEKARRREIATLALPSAQVMDAAFWHTQLKAHAIEVVALAGYIRKVPKAVVEAYAGRMLNIHPALLPKHGGKGMYGLRVHEAVLAAGAAQTGMTIHEVTDEYDEGKIVFQAAIDVQAGWSAQELQTAVKALEHTHFPRVLEQYCNRLSNKRP